MTEPGDIWDVVVVGAGPAGSTAARIAAVNGSKVLLLDRAVFPRHKTCGGGLIGKSIGVLPLELHSLIEQRPFIAEFTNQGKDKVVISRSDPFLGMIDREKMDARLVELAIDAGAVLHAGEVVREIHDQGDIAEVRTATAAYLARVVVGADGSAGRVSRYVGVQYQEIDLGLEDEIPISDEGEWRDRILLDWGPSPGSYAWMFPKRGIINVGVIQRKGEPDATREYLASWKRRLGVDLIAPLHSSGHLTQWRTPTSPLRRDRVIVAGDAAGLLEPWTREGISFALRSGEWAGEAAARASSESTTDALDAYVDRVVRELAPEQLAGAMVLAVFERRPRLVQALLRRAAFQDFFVRFCRGETSLARFGRRRWAMAVARRLAGA